MEKEFLLGEYDNDFDNLDLLGVMDYYVDIALCIDLTSGMKPLI